MVSRSLYSTVQYRFPRISSLGGSEVLLPISTRKVAEDRSDGVVVPEKHVSCRVRLTAGKMLGAERPRPATACGDR